MKLLLRARLVAAFVTVIAVTGIIGTAVGVYLVGSGIVREAQDRVALDINCALHIYEDRLRDIQERLEFTVTRKFAVREALRKGDRDMLLESLREAMREGELDTLAIADRDGRVVLRAHNPDVSGGEARGPIVGKALLHRKAFAGTRIVPQEELLKESRELAERARIGLVPTPRARPTDETENTSGMMLKAAVPIFDESGAFVGVLYGGILLNRNYDIVDRIKDIVYRGARYKGKDVGTATVFLNDLRISTNVMSSSGERAVGTRLSSEVHDRVVGEGRAWTARAFVVNDWYLTAYEPIRNVDGEVIGVLYVGILESKYVDMKRTTFWLLAGVTVAGMLLALAIAYALANAIVAPVQRLKGGVEALAEGDFDSEVVAETTDEIGALAESFNRVRQELKRSYEKLQGKVEAADEGLRKANEELREKQSQLVHAEKLASLGALAAGVAHEINNPLGTIALYAQMALDEMNGGHDHPRESIKVIVKHASRAARIVGNLLEFARRTELEKEPTSVNLILDEVLSITAHQAKLQQVDVAGQLADDVPMVMGDADKLRQVFMNVVINALQAMPQGGRLTVAAAAASNGGSVLVRVSDTGCGIPEDQIAKIFDPFFTTKEPGKGTGLGLSVSHGIIEQHGGEIAVDSDPGAGTTFTITIPAVPGENGS